MMDTYEELIAAFGTEINKPEVLSALQNYMNLYALTAEDLYIKWEQFSYNNRTESSGFNDSTLENFKVYLQQQIEKKINVSLSAGSSNPSSLKKTKALKPNISGSPSLFRFNMSKLLAVKKQKPLSYIHDSGVVDAPIKTELHESSSVDHLLKGETLSQSDMMPKESVLSPSSSRTNVEPDKILDSLNLEDLDISTGLDFDSQESVKITRCFNIEKYRFKTMRQSLLDASDVLDEQIDIFTDVIRDHFQLSITDFGDPTIQSQSQIITVGRIVSDSPAFGGVLNVDSLAIETSRSMGIGRRISLNLEKIRECSVFPGQIIAFRGKNANGEHFVVDEILPIPYLNSPVSTSEEIQRFQTSMNNHSMKIIVISGPYTSSSSFDFSNFSSFIDRINESIKPHVIIMFGPLIDITHPLIESGKLPIFPNLKNQPKTLDDVFMKVMVPILKKINSNIQVIVIPSTNDTLSNHPAYPQNSLDRKYFQSLTNFKCFPNPATFQLNEVFFGCSNNDVFRDLNEITKGDNLLQKNRFDRVSEHILEQRRYYPIFPGGIKTRKIKDSSGHDILQHISGADLEVPYLGLTEFVANIIPDIIIIPSELYHFSRVVRNVIMVNPGSFIKPNGNRGTYAQFSISTPNLEDGKLTKVESDGDIYLHNVWKRARVDILTA